MITDVDEATLQVVVLELLWGVVTVLTRGGAVDDEVTDGVGGHKHTGLDVCEEFFLICSLADIHASLKLSFVTSPSTFTITLSPRPEMVR